MNLETSLPRLKHVTMNVKASVRPGATRDIREMQRVEVRDDDLIEIEFEQGVRVWVNGADYRERFGIAGHRAMGAPDVLTIPSSLPMGDQRTRGVVSWAIKGLNVLGVDLARKTAVEIGRRVEESQSEYKQWLGLSRCTLEPGKFKLERPAKQTGEAQGPYLLFIHGTLSSTWGSFGELWSQERKDDPLSDIRARYEDRVLAFDHRTLTESPVDNTIQLIRELNSCLPNNAEVHLVTHSRGGLVGELLCWSGDEALPDEAFSEGKKRDAELRKSFQSLSKELKKKKFTVTRFVRVACPASGTTLASGRLDRWFSVLGSVLGSALPKTPLADVFEDVGGFIAAVIKERTKPESLPGIEAMMPESAFITAINQRTLTVSGDLAVIAGDIEPNKWWTRLLVWATDKYYESKHDLVVNTPSMYGGALRSGRALFSFHAGPDVNHFNYFRNADSAAKLIEALALPPKSNGSFDTLERNTEKIARAVQKKRADAELSNTAYKPPRTKTSHLPVAVSVVHGDLAFAAHPVMVGHYEGDTIISAEKYLDKELDEALTDRLLLGLYPGAIESNAIFPNPNLARSEYVALKGAIVVGLGQVGRLSAASLKRTVARAMQEYALQWQSVTPARRDDQNEIGVNDLAISSLLIGAGAGGISVADTVRAILMGVAAANRMLRSGKSAAKPFRCIRAIEFIELWEDRALEVAKELTRLTDDPDFREEFEFHLQLEERKGGKRRLSMQENPGWWQRLQILGGGLDGANSKTDVSARAPLRFSALTKRARVEVTLHQTQRTLVDDFIRQSITTTYDNDKIAQTLFELLLPNDLKDQAPEQDNLVLILDEEAAAYPWELLRDPDDKSDKPIAVQKGLLRQLETMYAPSRVRASGGFNALVVGDPISRFQPLPSAREEARAVWRLLTSEYFDAEEPLIQRSATEIINALYAKPYRILHLAGHGVYNFAMPPTQSSDKNSDGAKKHRRTGMILSDDIVLSPIEVRQMRNVPELVFINCCHLGRIEQASKQSEAENVRDDYNRMAANVATEFIRAGVRAVVAAGWAVDDDAANTFATTFYKKMLNGDPFGSAVQQAREETYRTHVGSNTWGAYQCYGDPDYRFRKMERKTPTQRAPQFVSQHEAAVEIENIAAGLAFAERDDRKYYMSKLERIESVLTEKGWSNNGRILAALGWAFGEAEEFGKAVVCYKRAAQSADGAMRYRDIREWANCEVRDAVRRVTENSASVAECEKNIHSAIERLNSLPSSPEILRLQGSAYKRIAIVNPASRISALQEMASKYEEAHTTKTKAEQFDAYGFLNWKAGELALALQRGNLRKERLHAELVQAQPSVEAAIKNKKDFWDTVMRNDLHLLLAITKEKIESAAIATLVDEYSEAKKLASAREFASVLDQLDFLATMAEGKDREVGDALREIHQKISLPTRGKRNEVADGANEGTLSVPPAGHAKRRQRAKHRRSSGEPLH